MRTIGVDVTEGLVYEGENNYGRGVSPTPTVLIATVFPGAIDASLLPESEDLSLAKYVFREDGFDPVTRLRRGRLYEKGDSGQPHQWHVKPHPASVLDSTHNLATGRSARLLHGFHAWPARMRLRVGPASSMVALGTREGYTLWRVVDIERMAIGEDLVTLRARGSLGLLPELNEALVPADGLPKVREVLDTLARSVYTSAPNSVIDRARDAAQWCIAVWLAERMKDRGLRTKDLGDLSKALQPSDPVIASLAFTIARLHARGKPGEQERRSLLPPMEADAEYALAAVGLVLREIRWAAT